MRTSPDVRGSANAAVAVGLVANRGVGEEPSAQSARRKKPSPLWTIPRSLRVAGDTVPARGASDDQDRRDRRRADGGGPTAASAARRAADFDQIGAHRLFDVLELVAPRSLTFISSRPLTCR